jgi:hypothetical protein
MDETSVESETLLRRAHELRASKETIDQTTKPCPKCSWNIEKNGGWYVFSFFPHFSMWILTVTDTVTVAT